MIINANSFPQVGEYQIRLKVSYAAEPTVSDQKDFSIELVDDWNISGDSAFDFC